MLTRRLLAISTLAAVVAVVGAQAAPDRTAACPAPKPLPAGVKKPPKSANATQLANFLLALPQRKPCDVNLFTSRFEFGVPGIYPEGRLMAPANGPLLTEGQVRAQLDAFLPAGPKRAIALRLFDQGNVKAKVSEPGLRAAFAALVGTVGESTQRHFLESTELTTMRFGGVSNPTAIASVSGNTIIFNRRYAQEHFGLLIGTVAHETLHVDNPVNGAEEAICTALTAMVTMQVLSRHPVLVAPRTEAVRQQNTFVAAFVNSRAPGSPASALVVKNGQGVWPGSARSRRDFWTAWYENAAGSSGSQATPAPAALEGVLRAVLRPGVSMPKPLRFSKKTAELFSKMNDTWLSPVDRLRVSVLLGLVSMDEIVKYTGLTRTKAIATFKLAPILRAMR